MNTTGSIRAIYTDAGRQKFEPLDSDIKAFRVINIPGGVDEVIERDPEISRTENISKIMHYTHAMAASKNG